MWIDEDMFSNRSMESLLCMVGQRKKERGWVNNFTVWGIEKRTQLLGIRRCLFALYTYKKNVSEVIKIAYLIVFVKFTSIISCHLTDYSRADVNENIKVVVWKFLRFWSARLWPLWTALGLNQIQYFPLYLNLKYFFLCQFELFALNVETFYLSSGYFSKKLMAYFLTMPLPKRH